MKEKNKLRAKFYVERDSLAVHAAVIFMALSAVFRLVGCWGMLGDQYFAATQIALPLVCNLLFIVFILLLGAHAFWLTTLPVILGVIFFIIKSLTFASWVHTLLCILLYIVVAMLYTATAFGIIRTKWLLVPLFGLPFIYHIFVEDAAALRDTANPVTFAAGLQEISVLCIMLSLLFTAFAMKKRQPAAEVELPKIKDPKVIIPKPAEETAAKETAVSNEELPAAPAETVDVPQIEAQSGDESKNDSDTDNTQPQQPNSGA